MYKKFSLAESGWQRGDHDSTTDEFPSPTEGEREGEGGREGDQGVGRGNPPPPPGVLCRVRSMVSNLRNTTQRIAFSSYWAGIARTQSPIRKNNAIESSTFGTIAGVSQAGVQWKGLTLEEPPG